MVYFYDVQVIDDDVDETNLLKLDRLFKMVEKSTTSFLKQNTLDSFTLMSTSNRTLVVLRNRVNYNSFIRLYSNLKFVVSVYSITPLSFTLETRIFNSNSLCATIYSEICGIYFTSRKIVSIIDLIKSRDCFKGIIHNESKFIAKFPKAIDLITSHSVIVTKEDIDKNNHLNNVSYIGYLLQSPLLSFESTKIVSLEIHYINEVILGEEITFKYLSLGNFYYFVGIVKDKIRTRIILEKK